MQTHFSRQFFTSAHKFPLKIYVENICRAVRLTNRYFIPVGYYFHNEHKKVRHLFPAALNRVAMLHGPASFIMARNVLY